MRQILFCRAAWLIITGKPPADSDWWQNETDEKTAEANNLVVGVYVVSVEEFSAAEKAGIKAGDVIIEADEKDIETMDELNEIKNQKQIGDTMKLKINRNGQEKDVTITLQEQP